MIFKLKLRLNHWWQKKILKKKPVVGRIFIKEGPRKRILIRPWAEVESLFLKRMSWRSFVGSNLTCNQRYCKVSAGWDKIIYE